MVKAMPGKIEEKKIQTNAEAIELPPSKIGDPNDVANVVLFLASDESRFVNGAQLRVDNGISIVSGVVPN